MGAGARVGARVRPGADRGYGREVAAGALEGGLRGSGSAGRAGGWPLCKLLPRRGPIRLRPALLRARPAREAPLGGEGWGALGGPSGGGASAAGGPPAVPGAQFPAPIATPPPGPTLSIPEVSRGQPGGGVGRGAESEECRLHASQLQRPAQKCPGSEALPREEGGGGTFLLPPGALLVSPSWRGPSHTERTPRRVHLARREPATPYLTTTRRFTLSASFHVCSWQTTSGEMSPWCTLDN